MRGNRINDLHESGHTRLVLEPPTTQISIFLSAVFCDLCRDCSIYFYF